MHATIDVRLDVWIDTDKTLTLAGFAEAITDLEIESSIVEQAVESLDECLVEAICGPKHTRGNGNRRFQRAGTTTRKAVTTAGEHEFNLHYVKDTAAGNDETTYSRPIDDVIAFDGQRIYQEDISAQAVDRATTSSYRDAVADGDGFPSMPSISTINRRVKDHGAKLTDFMRDQLADLDATTIFPDATNSHSQDDDRSHHDVRVTLGQDTERDADESTILDVSVNDSWEEIAAAHEEIVDEKATVVSDAEENLVDAFVDDERVHQLDLLHFCRTTEYYLWKDEQLPLEDRNEYVKELKDAVFHLKNSVAKHHPAGEYEAILHRIDRTRERIASLADELEDLDCQHTVTYLRKWFPSVVSFARQAIDEVEVPWTSNLVERAMGQIAKRCKHQWMRWTEEGLESMLTLVLVNYADPDLYEDFVDDLIGRSTKTTMTCEVSVDATRGEL